MSNIIQDLIEAEDLLEANQRLKIIDEALEKQTINRPETILHSRRRGKGTVDPVPDMPFH